MSKYQIFKCKRLLCCRGSWIVAQDGWPLKAQPTHAAAIAYLQRLAA